MRGRFFPAVLVAAFIPISTVLASAQSIPTAKLLSSGSLAASPDLVITDDSLPEDAFLQNPTGVAVSAEGHLYVCDYGANHIKHFDASGKFLGAIGRKGSGPGDLSSPGYIAAGAGRICVWEWGNRRFSLFTADGEFVNTFAPPQEFTRILKVRMLPDGRVAVLAVRDVFAGKENSQVGAILIDTPDDDAWKTVYERRIEIWKRIDEPAHFSVPLPFNPKICWDILPGGRLVVGYAESYELEILDPDAGHRTVFRTDYKPVAVTAKDKETHFASMTVAIVGPDGSVSRKSGAPDYIVSNTSFPKNKPAFREIAADDEGNVWIEPYLQNRAEEGTVFDVLEADGSFKRGIRIAGGGSFPRTERSSSIIGKTFWKIETGEDGFPKLVRYRIGGS
jgi:hypothetical protein